MCCVLTEAHSRNREAQDVLCVALTKPSSPTPGEMAGLLAPWECWRVHADECRQ
jgi:hypothetical protein